MTNFSHLAAAEISDIGRQRRHNEDATVALAAQGVFAAFDGMGGSAGGAEASQNARDALQQRFAGGVGLPQGPAALRSRALLVRSALNEASRKIRARADAAGTSGSGTTAVVLLFDDYQPQRALALHAGDSRLYRYRDGDLQQLTRDHSFAAAAGVMSEKSLPPMFRGVVTRAVGLENEVVLEETSIDVVPGDLFLLCTDGLTKMLSDAAIAQVLAGAADIGGDLNKLASILIEEANTAGGHDNVSLILIGVSPAMRPVQAAAPVVPPPLDETLAGETVDIHAPGDLVSSKAVAPATTAGGGWGVALLACLVTAAAAVLWLRQGFYGTSNDAVIVPALPTNASPTNSATAAGGVTNR